MAPLFEKESQGLSYKHQPYCWQVALQQSLRPLEVDNNKISSLKIFKNITTVGKKQNVSTAHCVTATQLLK
jgi:hypothetical protein